MRVSGRLQEKSLTQSIIDSVGANKADSSSSSSANYNLYSSIYNEKIISSRSAKQISKNMAIQSNSLNSSSSTSSSRKQKQEMDMQSQAMVEAVLKLKEGPLSTISAYNKGRDEEGNIRKGVQVKRPKRKGKNGGMGGVSNGDGMGEEKLKIDQKSKENSTYRRSKGVQNDRNKGRAVPIKVTT